MKRILSKAEFAKDQRVSKTMVTKWIAAGLPVTPQGRIDRAKAIEWLKANTTRPTAKLETYVEARARKERSLADLRELDALQRRGEVVAVNDAFDILEEFVSVCRARLLAIPTTAAPELVGQPDLAKVQAVLKRHVYDALNELASGAGIVEKAKERQAQRT